MTDHFDFIVGLVIVLGLGIAIAGVLYDFFWHTED
jgi:hypothetical protein